MRLFVGIGVPGVGVWMYHVRENPRFSGTLTSVKRMSLIRAIFTNTIDAGLFRNCRHPSDFYHGVFDMKLVRTYSVTICYPVDEMGEWEARVTKVDPLLEGIVDIDALYTRFLGVRAILVESPDSALADPNRLRLLCNSASGDLDPVAKKYGYARPVLLKSHVVGMPDVKLIGPLGFDHNLKEIHNALLTHPSEFYRSLESEDDVLSCQNDESK